MKKKCMRLVWTIKKPNKGAIHKHVQQAASLRDEYHEAKSVQGNLTQFPVLAKTYAYLCFQEITLRTELFHLIPAKLCR